MTKECACHFCGAKLIRKLAPSLTTRFHFCDTFCKGQWQRTFKPVSREWLEDHYITKHMNCTQIAHIVKRDPKSVWNWLKDFKIPTRPRGSDKNQHFKKGYSGAMLGRKHSLATREKLRAARIKDGHVPYLKDGVHYLKGKRGEDTPNWKGGVTPERQSFYASDEWKDAVKIIWKRTRGICERCLSKQAKANRGTYHIHHIVSFMVRHLRADADNLVLLCRPCHLFVHSNENVTNEFIREVAEC